MLLLTYAEYRHGVDGTVFAVVRAQGFKVRYPDVAAPFDPPPQFLYTRPLPGTYPLQLAVSATSPLMSTLAASRGALLEIPVGTGSGGTPGFQARAQYRSIFHRRPLVNGYSGYYPHEFPARMALARELPDPLALARLRNQTALASILVHLDELAPEERQQWLIAQVGRADLWLERRDGNDLLFTVASAGATQ